MTASADTAALLPVGDAFLGDLDGPSDSDWIKAELTAGATYELTLTTRDPDGADPRHGAGDTILEIYNRQRELIASADDRPFVDGVLPPGGFHPQLSFTPASGGVHYFRVSSYIYPGADNSGGYRLELAGPPSPEPDPEPDPAPDPDPDPDTDELTHEGVFQFDDNVYPSTTPSAVTELTTVSLFGAVLLRWEPRLDVRLREKALIYRADENDFSQAVLIHTSEPGASGFSDSVDPGTYYYWARYMTQDGALGPVYPRPGGDSAPIEGISDDISRLPGLERLDPDPDPDPPVVREPVTGQEGRYASDYSVVKIGGAGDDALDDQGAARSLRFALLDGRGGDDTLTTGAYQSVLIGGPGNDVFVVVGGFQTKIMDFEDGKDKIKIGRSGDPILDFYNTAQEAGLTWDMRWIATEQAGYNDDAVVVDTGEGEVVTIYDVFMGDLQFEVVGGDLFIV